MATRLRKKIPLANVAERPPWRVVIEHVRPEVDGGAFPVKRIVGDLVTVEATIFADGHDDLSCRLLYRREEDAGWTAVELTPLGNDQWRGEFRVPAIGRYRYTVEGWVDHFRTWRRELGVRIEAGQDVGVEVLIGARLIDEAAGRASGDDAKRLRMWARDLGSERDPVRRNTLALVEDLAELALRHPDRASALRYDRELAVVVDRERARFSTWYEVFPRSCAPEAGRHGTLRDCAAWLPDIAAMGFDVLYLPPIHPIGRTLRKGKNNASVADPDDVGSPWAIGAREGGHTAVHPDLGTLEDFLNLVAQARALDMDVALDLAYQCAPDHPYVIEHPEWFKKRPDGTIQYAENPPKKYQDIYPFDFECAEWRALWEELRRVILFWIEQGVRIFRVDNPHTKALPFWDWVIADVKGRYPDLILLAEAFTRPSPMYRLAKLGFSQSYTYFTWRNTKQELTDYFEELSRTGVREYFRPESVAEYPRHPPRVSADRRAARVHRAGRARGHARCELRDLRARLRAGRKRAARARQRGVPACGEVRTQAPRSALAGQPASAARATEPHQAGESRAAIRRRAAVPRHGQRGYCVLQQGDRRPGQRHRDGRESRSDPPAIRLGHPRPAGPWADGRRDV